MGSYVYSIRTKAVRALVNGEKRNVYLYKYSYKPYFTIRSYGGDDRREAKAITSLQKILRREKHPDDMIYVSFGDPREVNARVYRCRREQLQATIYDNYFDISQPVGYLYRYKLGRKKPWIVAMEQTLLP